MKRAGIILLSLFIGALKTSAQDGDKPGEMLFLHLLQKNGIITVLDAKIVSGTPRERFPESGPRWELVSGSGTISGTGIMPPPKPTYYDYRDETGTLTGGVLSEDSIDFFTRIPYSATDEKINFYKSSPTGLSKAQTGSSLIGSCLIREVLR